ncbi:MAG: murein biosynthesis integral membrane protein MurJ [Caloramator sp.]|nr:murein biosynthesis integral membrane protein MurJ [Caloramator sp.]
MSEIKKVAKYSILVTILLTISKLVGFIREFLIAAKFGATRESDIFKIASTMPTVLFSCIAAALVTAFIPVFAGIKRDSDRANDFFNNILNIILLICIILSIIGIVFSPQLTYMFASGFKGRDFDTTVYMTRILMPSIIFLGISGLYTGYLQSYDIFIQPTIASIVANFVIIAGILFFYKYGIISAIIATFFGAVAQAYTQRPYMKGYKYKFYINFKDINVQRILKLAVPTIISTAVSQINLMVGRNFASNLVAGSISVYDYSYKINSIINLVFITSITTVLYPSLTEKYATGKFDEFKDMILKSINLILIVAIPFILGVYALSTPVVMLLLEHGKFDRNATLTTSMCLKFISFSALGYSLIDIFSRIFYSAKDTVTPMINGFINVGINVLLIFLLVPRFKISGLALSTTLSTLIISTVMFIEIIRKIKYKNYFKNIITLFKTLLSGIIMAIIVGLVYRYMDNLIIGGTLILTLKIAVSTVIGAIVYCVMLNLLKVEEFKLLISIFKRKKIGE